MCELAKLPMVICTETIDTISLSGYTKIYNNQNYQTTTLLSKYVKRLGLENMSLHEFFHMTKNEKGEITSKREIVPHYVGGSGQPVYPITQNYARVELMKHRPWGKSNPIPPDDDIIKEFKEFLNSPNCPISVKVSYERAKIRVIQKRNGLQETISQDQESSNPLTNTCDKETKEILTSTQNIGITTDEFQNIENAGLDIGKNYDWSMRHYKVRNIKILKIKKKVCIIEIIP